MKKTLILLLSVCIAFIGSISAFAASLDDSDVVYNTYVYNGENEPIKIPTAYSYIGKITGGEITDADFGELSDLFYSRENGKIYVADCAKNRIVVLNSDYSLDKVIDSFECDGKTEKFNSPQGVCVKNGILYVADTKNARIVTFDINSYAVIKIFNKPVISQLGPDYTYEPTKIAVGITGQMYIIGKTVNSGFIVLDSVGKFQSFVGAPLVKTNFLDEFWKLFMSKKQKQNMLKNVPTEYNSVVFDSEGFLYATTQSADVQPITRLNLQGSDILSYEVDYPQGDGLYKSNSSAFVDVCVDENGVYFALDSNSGRVFAYNSSGNLLFAFGTKGNQNGALNSPCSIEIVGNDLLIADAVSGMINIYEKTKFSDTVLKADAAVINGDYRNAKKLWSYVSEKCAAYTLATDSLGRVALYEKDYKSAMNYFSNASNKSGYSDAFREYRTEFIYNNYGIIVAVIIVLIVIIVLYVKIMSKTKFISDIKSTKAGKGLKYASYCCFHPFDGFWCLKREKKGNLLTANILSVLFLIVYTLNVQFSGYLFIDGDRDDVNALVLVLGVLVLMICYCVSNWCFTSLMDGKGTLKEIYISMAVALKPYIVGGLFLFGLSWVLSEKEIFIYTTVKVFVLIWVAALLFFGMIMTHDYSVGNGIKTVILTVIGMALIIFIVLVITNLLEDMVEYFYGIYREVLYRNL